VLSEVRLLAGRVSIQPVVPEAVSKLCVLLLNDVPFHQASVVVSSMASAVAVMAVLSPEFDEAVPVTVPVQSAP
jgi:hypothetical protein